MPKGETTSVAVPISVGSGIYSLSARELDIDKSCPPGNTSPDIPMTLTWIDSPTLAVVVEGESQPDDPVTGPQNQFWPSENGFTETFRIIKESFGNLFIELRPFIGSFNGLWSVRAANATTLLPSYAVKNGFGDREIAYTKLDPGEYILEVSYQHLTTPQSGLVRWSEPIIVPNGSTTTQTRNFTDAAGEVFEEARVIELNSNNKGDDSTRLDAVDDVDYFVFQANTMGEIEIDVIPHGTLVTNVTFFDAQIDDDEDGNPDGEDSDASDSADGLSHLVYDVIAGGTYYLRVECQ